jgi:hypothetical protein
LTDRADALILLRTDEGRGLLEMAESLPPDRLTRITALRRRALAHVAATAVELLELRRRAAAKFPYADRMFFTPSGLEMSTGERIARFRAARFPEGAPVLDACCGIGGDALCLAGRGPVLAVDRDLEAALCAQSNARALQPGSALHALCADATALDLTRLKAAGVSAALFDPARRSPAGGRSRSRSAEECAPPLSWLRALRSAIADVAVKLSPMIDDALLNRSGARVELISDQGECKEAALWYGGLAAELPLDGWSATVLRAGHPPATLVPAGAPRPPVSAVEAWLVEPDAAVIRAHRIPELAAQTGAALLDPAIAYLTSDTETHTPFARCYRVIESMPFNLKHVQSRLRSLGRRVYAIKRRGGSIDPNELAHRLTGDPDSDERAIVVIAYVNERPLAILCEP